jgi:hypothetical protein
MTDAIEALLYPIFKAQGAADAAGLAHRAARDFDMDQRDRHIYELRASMTELDLAHRFGLSVRRVQQIVREQHAAIPKIA